MQLIPTHVFVDYHWPTSAWKLVFLPAWVGMPIGIIFKNPPQGEPNQVRVIVHLYLCVKDLVDVGPDHGDVGGDEQVQLGQRLPGLQAVWVLRKVLWPFRFWPGQKLADFRPTFMSV